MTENPAAARMRAAKPIHNPGSGAERPVVEGAEAVREFAQQGSAYTKDMYEKAKVAAEETNKALAQTYATASKGAADFNTQWIEMARTNSNCAFDFARQLIGAKSPSEFLELSAAHARKQFETLSEQAQQLTSLVQKVATDAVQPLQDGVKSAFNRAA